ncbi:MAG: XRE family transcriptional regulator [Cyanobacteria bacterium J069]|nr:MAG: XRE family transcriptional regulator [Cyanobacteria bacterium J069]
MRVRRVQEVDIPDLSSKLLTARKSSSESLLEICRRLDITPTYWYKLEKAENSTISYDLLKKIDALLSLNLDIRFPEDSEAEKKPEKTMNLSNLKWVKVVTPADDWRSYWAYTSQELTQMKKDGGAVVNNNGVSIFPLGFRQDREDSPAIGDLILLTQHSKVTHIVEVLDEKPEQHGDWFNRYVKVIWWKPEMDWKTLPDRNQVLGFNLVIQSGIFYRFGAFERFNAEWGGRQDAFLKHLTAELEKI